MPARIAGVAEAWRIGQASASTMALTPTAERIAYVAEVWRIGQASANTTALTPARIAGVAEAWRIIDHPPLSLISANLEYILIFIRDIPNMLIASISTGTAIITQCIDILTRYVGIITNITLSYLTDNNLIIDDRLLNAILLMIVLIGVNFTIYNVLDRILMKLSYAYPKLSHANKRYVVKNLSKSGVLLLLLLRTTPALWNMFLYDQWDNALISTIGIVYASTDLTGLLFVPNLPTATIVHHICVMVIATINVFMDYTQEGLHRAFISLTILSMIPYLVNTYLGMRHLEGVELKRWIVKICLWVYSVSVLFNCFLQHAYIFCGIQIFP